MGKTTTEDRTMAEAEEFIDMMLGADLREWAYDVNAPLSKSVPKKNNPIGFEFDSSEERLEAIREYIPVVRQLRTDILGEEKAGSQFLDDWENRIRFDLDRKAAGLGHPVTSPAAPRMRTKIRYTPPR